MSSVDFHVNVEPGAAYICRLVRKIHAAGKTVLVFSRQEDRLARLDQALWTFSVLDFLPHVMLPHRHDDRTPIWLSSSAPAKPRDVLLLQDDEVPDAFASWFNTYDRVIDVVSSDTHDRERGRRRFKAYRDAGVTPSVHDLAAVT
jgi:DNA polymerase-3 subunit chi